MDILEKLQRVLRDDTLSNDGEDEQGRLRFISEKKIYIEYLVDEDTGEVHSDNGHFETLLGTLYIAFTKA